jgi:flagellar hook-associated protein 2
VTAIVASEIEPKRILQSSKKEKTESAISGIGFLNSQVGITQKNFQTIKSGKFFNVTSSNTTGVEVVPKDETKLTPGFRTLSDVSIAKKMIYELSGFTSLTQLHSANLTIDHGSWAKTSYTDTADYASQITYVVTSELSGADVTTIRNNSSWTDLGATIPVGSKFTINNGANGNLSSAKIKQADSYAFTDKNLAHSDALNFSYKTVGEVVSLINAQKDLEAKIVDTTGEGTNFSVIITGDETGLSNAFRITGHSRWETSTVPDANQVANQISNNFSQLSSDASFKLDGVDVTRKKNSITDLIEGASIELKSDFTAKATIGISRSEAATKKTVEDVIFSLNEFKDEIDRLTFIDVDGDKNGDLAMDPSATSIKNRFKRLAVQPIKGFGDKSVYLSQLGIKTDSNGQYFLDEYTFNKTFSENPQYFGGLKDDNLSASSSEISISKSEFTKMEEGSITVSKVGDQWKIGEDHLTRVDYNGGSRFTSVKHPGLVMVSASVDPGTFNVYVGENFSKKIDTLMNSILDLESPLNSARESYQNLTSDIEERLTALEERENLITTKYTAQFGKMEQSMTQFNSTKSLLDNFIEAWKKQK